MHPLQDQLLECVSPVFKVVKHIETRAGGREQHHVTGAGQGMGQVNGLIQAARQGARI